MISTVEGRQQLNICCTEMEYFLQQRLEELTDEQNIEFANQYQECSEKLLRSQDSNAVSIQLKAVKEVRQRVADPNIQKLVMIR